MSSLVFLGLSLLAFIISFGLVWIIVPMVLGSFFTAISNTNLVTGLSTSWQLTYNQTQTQVQWLIPLSVQLGIFILVLKVLMVASNKGGD